MNPEPTLEDLLRSMTQYGCPRLSKLGETWVCVCELALENAPGATTAVVSEYTTHRHPQAAAYECYERVLQTVAHMEFVTKPPSF